MTTTYLQVAVGNVHVVQVLDGAHDFAHEDLGVLLGVGALLHDTIKKLATGHPTFWAGGGWPNEQKLTLRCSFL